MKLNNIIGIAMIIVGVLVGLYVGIWLMFIGGIVGLVNIVVGLFHGQGINGLLIGLNIVKIIFAGLVGWLSALAMIIPGYCKLK